MQLGHGLCAYGFRPSDAVSKVYNNKIKKKKYIYIYNIKIRKPFPIVPKLDTHLRRGGLLQLIYYYIILYVRSNYKHACIYKCTIYIIYMLICNELCVCKNRNQSFTGLMYYIIDYIFPVEKCYSNVFIKIKTIKQSIFFLYTQYITIINEKHLGMVYYYYFLLNPF